MYDTIFKRKRILIAKITNWFFRVFGRRAPGGSVDQASELELSKVPSPMEPGKSKNVSDFVGVGQLAGRDPLAKAQWLVLSTYFVTAYQPIGVNGRGWVRKEPVAALFHALYLIVMSQKDAGEASASNACEYLFRRFGKDGLLTLPDRQFGPSNGFWVSPFLALDVARQLQSALSLPVDFNLQTLNDQLGAANRQALFEIAFYGKSLECHAAHWEEEITFVHEAPTCSLGKFRVHPLLSSRGVSCTLENLEAKWLLVISNGLEWAAIDDVLNQIQDGAIDARAGKFHVYPPSLAGGEMQDYTLKVESVSFYFPESDFTDFVDVLRKAWDSFNTGSTGGAIAYG